MSSNVKNEQLSVKTDSGNPTSAVNRRMSVALLIGSILIICFITLIYISMKDFKLLYTNIVNADYSEVIDGLVGEWTAERLDDAIYTMVVVFDEDYNVLDNKIRLCHGDIDYAVLKMGLEENHDIYRIDFLNWFINSYFDMKKDDSCTDIEREVGSITHITRSSRTLWFADEKCILYSIDKSIANDPLCDLLYETMGEEVNAIRDRRFFSLPFIENKESSVGE